MLKIPEKKAKKYSNIITTASITLIILIYVFPLTTVKIGPSSPYFLYIAHQSPETLVAAIEDPENATFNLYYSYDTMQKSFYEDVVELSKDVTNIIAVIWIQIIISLISYIAVLSSILEKKFTSKLLYISCFSSITGVVILALIIDFIRKNQINPNLETSSVIFIDFPLKYIYFILLILLVYIFASIMYTKILLSSMIKYKKENKYIDKEKNIDKKNGEKNHNEIERINSFNINEGKDLKFRLKTQIYPDENKKETIKPKSDNKEYKIPFNYDKENKKETNEVYIEKTNIKCPQCGSIFEAEKNPGEITKIKCPTCGKEGVIEK